MQFRTFNFNDRIPFNTSIMQRFYRLPLVAAMFLVSVTFIRSGSADVIRKVGGGTENGKFEKMSKTEISLGSPKEISVPVNEIQSFSFTSEPSSVKDAREAIESGRYEDVEGILAVIKLDTIKNDEIKIEIGYIKALADARAASLGNAEPKITAAAGSAMISFLAENPDSYHFYEANEVVGNLLASMKNPQATKYYDTLATAPWPDYKMRAAILKGRADQLQAKHDTAIKHFDAALALAGGKGTETQASLARIFKAVSMAESKQIPQALALVEDVIAKTEGDDKELFARAYNALGICHYKNNAKQEALLAFLHVELLFNTQPDAHAEALYYLARLWTDEKNPERAKAAAETLRSRYATSRWAKG